MTDAAQGNAQQPCWMGFLSAGNTDVSYMVGYGGTAGADQEGQFFAQGEYASSGVFATASGDAYDVISDVPCPLNEWFHIASVLSDSVMTLYLNGELIFEKTIAQPEISVSSGCWIGSSPYNGGGVNSFWLGAIDDIGIWSRNLSEFEVLQLYESSIIQFGCTDLSACNFNPTALVDDGSCTLADCTDPQACNFNSEAACDDGSCDYSCCPGPGCCDLGLTWNWELSLCQDLNQ